MNDSAKSKHSGFGLPRPFVWLLGIGVALSLVLPSAADADTSRTPVDLACDHADDVDPANAAEVCNEFSAFLGDAYPGRVFLQNSAGPRKVELHVTKANERSIAMEVTFFDDKGQITAGVPLQMSFFDRNSDPELRKRFYTEFLRQNPIPF